MQLHTILFSAGVLTAVPALAAEVHRELGPHQHGHGILNIAVEKNRVSMDLDVPGLDIVGFEHKPESADQKAVAQKAEKQLGDALALFKVPASAQCKVAEAKVSIEAEGAHGAGGEKEIAVAEQKPSPAETDAKGGSPEQEGHNEYNVSYVLDCAQPSKITSIEFGYFKAFAGAKALTVNIVSQNAQNAYEVTREKPVLDLGGMM